MSNCPLQCYYWHCYSATIDTITIIGRYHPVFLSVPLFVTVTAKSNNFPLQCRYWRCCSNVKWFTSMLLLALLQCYQRCDHQISQLPFRFPVNAIIGTVTVMSNCPLQCCHWHCYSATRDAITTFGSYHLVSISVPLL